MNHIFPALTLALAAFTPLHAQESGATPDFKRRAHQFMTATDPAKRKAAYRSWMQLGPEALPDFQQALDAAAQSHAKQLDDLARGRKGGNPYTAYYEPATQLTSERARVMELLKTDFHKDPAKVKMLREEMLKLEKLRTRVHHLAAADTTRFDAALDATVAAMAEVVREQERFDKSMHTISMSDKDLREELLANHEWGAFLTHQRDAIAKTRKEAAELTAAEKANAAQGRWASPPMKNFTTLLNKERNIVGLNPLRLEEKICDASRGHSEDMARLGFFAHESPVEGKKTPWDRIKLAGFHGSGTSENIFAGSTSFQAAYDAWFASDGHRFNLFGGGCDTLGVGIAGSHWTMNGGQANP